MAHVLKVPPFNIREKNLYKNDDKTHYLLPITFCTLQDIWSQLLQKSNYNNKLQDIEKFNAENKWKKRGIAFIPTKFGMSFGIKMLNQAGALVHVYTDGTVLVSHGGTEMGQGLHTKMIQIAAKAFGIPITAVKITETSTDKVANTAPTAASVSSDINGMAVLNACEQILARLVPFKKQMPSATLAEIAKAAWLERVNLSANGFYATPISGFNWTLDPTSPCGVIGGVPYHYFSYGAAYSEVEIDTLTGDYSILKTEIVMDVGKSLNPAIDIGQIEGAFIQGVGYFTLEEITFKKDGAMFTKGPGAYKIPSFNDIPIEFNVSILKNSPADRTVHSSKGVGEPPLFLAASVFFAIRNAIIAARSSNGIHDAYFTLNAPATSEQIRVNCVDNFLRK